jgi:hypothetical protein
MPESHDYSVASARTAAEHDQLAEWVTRFLASPGSDNAPLGQKLSAELRWWAGPVLLPIDRLHRLAGPAGDPVLCPVDDEYWDDRVDAMESQVEQGAELPPVIVSRRRDQLVVEDGNHRVESLRRAGETSTWAVVGFADAREREAFVAQWADRDDGGRLAEPERT